MIRWFIRQLDKLPTSPGLIRSGHWRVRYSGVMYSRKMTYDCAENYAKIFGGVIVWVRYDDPLKHKVAT